MRPHFSPTYRVPSGTSRAKSEVVFSDLFRRKLRDGRSRKDRSERGPHHAKGTRYVGELFGRPVGSISCHSVVYSSTKIRIYLILEWCCTAPLAVVPGRAAPLGVEILEFT